MTRARFGAAALVMALHAAALWLLLRAPAPVPGTVGEAALATFDVRDPPPPPPPDVRRPTPAPAPARAEAPSGPRAPTIVMAPAIPLPLPVIAIPPAGGNAVAGAGSGSGRIGSGNGGGGDGGGGGTPARLLKGAIRARDYPGEARRMKAEGSVTVRFTVDVDGRVRNCTVAQSSGNAALDATTCRLIAARFRYAPARDAARRPIVQERGWRQRWWLQEPRGPQDIQTDG